MPDVVVRRLDEFESNHEMYYRVRAGLGVSSFGLSIERWPAGSDFYQEHAEEIQEEEVYPHRRGAGRGLLAARLHGGGCSVAVTLPLLPRT